MKQTTKTNYSSITDSACAALFVPFITWHNVKKKAKIKPLYPTISASPAFTSAIYAYFLPLAFILYSRDSVVTELMYSKAMDLETSAEQQTAYVYLII